MDDGQDSSYSFHPAFSGAQAVEYQAGSRFNAFSDAATKGVAGAFASGGLSIYNTFADYTGLQQQDVRNTLNQIDQSYGDYYEQNKGTLDTLGFLGASIPMMFTGTEALQFARGGEATGALARALGYLPNKNKLALADAIESLGTTGISMAEKVAQSRYSRLAWATADQTLNAAAAESAVLLTMNQNPLLEDYSTKDFLTNMLIGGGIGGLIEMRLGSKILGTAADTVEKKARLFDKIFDPAKSGLDEADRMGFVVDSLMELSTKKADDTQFIYKYGRTQNVVNIPTTDLFESIRRDAAKAGYQKIEELSNALASGSTQQGQAFSNFIVATINKMKGSGLTEKEIVEHVDGIIGSLVRVESALDTDIAPASAFYVRKGAIQGVQDSLVEGFDPKLTYKTPYQLAEGVKKDEIISMQMGPDSKIGDVRRYFEAGADLVYTKNGRGLVNPNSSRLVKARDPLAEVRPVLDLESGALITEWKSTVGDLIQNAKKDIIGMNDKVIIGGREFKQLASQITSLEDDLMNATARYVYASKLDEKAFMRVIKEEGVQSWDFPMMDRLSELASRADLSSTKIHLSGFDDEVMTLEELLQNGNLKDFIKKQKIEWLKDALTGHNIENTTELSARLNTTREWVERAIAGRFDPRLPQLSEGLMETRAAANPRAVRLKMDYEAKPQFYRGTDANGVEYAAKIGERILQNNFDAQKLAEKLGVTIYDDSTIASARAGTADLAKKSIAFAAAYATKGGAITDVDVFVSQAKKALKEYAKLGVNVTDVQAHELGHALHYFYAAFSDTFNTMVSKIEAVPTVKLNELRKELMMASAEFRPQQWRNQRWYVTKGQELYADAFAAYFLKPSVRDKMPLFRAEFSNYLSSMEELFNQSIWQASAGPKFLADAAIGREYRLRMFNNQHKNAFSSVFGGDAELFMPESPELREFVSSMGAGSSLFGASNASYGEKAKAFVQFCGKITTELMTKRKNAALESMAPHFNAIRNNVQAAAELGVITTALRRSPESYFFDPVSKRLFTDSVMEHMVVKQFGTLEEAANDLLRAGKNVEMKITSESTRDFLFAHAQLNQRAQEEMRTLMASTGLSRNVVPLRAYVPPIDTVKYPFVAFVREKGNIGSMSGTSMITAKDADQLRKLVSQLPEGYEAILKDDVSAFYKARGEYEYGMTVSDSRVDSDLRRRGILGDFTPETRAENILSDYANHHIKQQEKLVRTGVQLNYSNFFSDLRFLSDQYTRYETSMAKGQLAIKMQKIADPFGDYTKTALGISKQGEFPLLDAMNEFVDTVGRKIYSIADSVFGKAKAGLIDWESANRLAVEKGLPSPFTSMQNYLEANARYPKNVIGEVAGKVNSLLATFGLRLDFMNSLVNIISTPIMMGMELSSFQKLAKDSPETLGAIADLYTTKVPGAQMKVPAFSKLVFNAVKNYFGEEGKQLIEKYKASGHILDLASLHHQMLDELAYNPANGFSAFKDKVNGWIEKGGKYTGNEFAEQFTRFVAANAMDQLTAPLVVAKKISQQEADGYISIFVNRTQGNYVASQRPVLFQGTTGRAVSLFQTYMFNVMQQLHRHIGDGNTRALMTFGGLQTAVYGLNGLPYFDAVNKYLIGNMDANPGHQDIYSVLPNMNKEIGEWMLYGTASAFPLFDGKAPALFSRGDLNPRNLAGLPLTPTDVPAISAGIKLVDTLSKFAGSLSTDGSVLNSLLMAVEHQGISRPLAGFAQVLGGRSTTSKGALISAANDMETTTMLSGIYDRAVNFGGVWRVLGARPMDEAMLLNTVYRDKYYHTMDLKRQEEIGVEMKTKLYGNQAPSMDDLTKFMTKYTAAGGTLEGFQSAMQRWSRDANVSVLNQLASNLRSPYSQRLQVLMGGEPVGDYQNQPSE